MKPIRVTLALKQLVFTSALVTAALLIVYLRPSTGTREFELLGLLGIVSLIPVSLIMYEHSNRMMRAMRMTRREHALFRAAAEGSLKPYAICRPVCDRLGHVVDYRFSYTNRSAERLLKTDRKGLVRQAIGPFLVSKSAESLTVIFKRVAATGTREAVQIGVISGGEEVEVLETDLEPMGSCVALAMNRFDLEEVTSAKIRELQEFAQSIIESAPISMIATDAAGTIIAVNAAAEQLTLYRRHDLIEQHSLTVLHDPLELSARMIELNRELQTPIRAGFDVLTAKSKPGSIPHQEWTYLRKDGSRAWVNLTMTTLQTPDRRVTGHLGIAFDVTERKLLTDSVVHMARHDHLTGLPNRSLLNDRLAQGMSRVKRFGQKLAVFVVDVDHFKRINDSLGHSAGDTVLTFVARQLESSLRTTDTVARVGGDEFVVLMPDFGSREDAERCANLMLQKICTPLMIDEREVRMTASIGICLYPDDAESGTAVLRRADVAMYEAKAGGRGCARTFSFEMEQEATDRLAMEEELRHAIINGEFKLHYQPQVDCLTGCVNGMELLLRWESPKRGDVPPSVFIPIAEEAGLMIEIGEWSVRQACLDCVDLQTQLEREIRVAVNLSPRQFLQKNLTQVVEDALEHSGLAPRMFELEITEQMLMASTPCLRETLARLRDLKVSLAIDDFGTGFSSFSYIMEYHVDRLKIDRSFVSKLQKDETAGAIVRAIIAMARSLNIQLVAEGVETREQLEFLARKRCESVQGFLFSKAVPIEELAGVVAEIEKQAPEPGPSDPRHHAEFTGVQTSSARGPLPLASRVHAHLSLVSSARTH